MQSESTEDTPRHEPQVHRVTRVLASTLLFSILFMGGMCAFIGGIWAYNELLTAVWNAVFQTDSPSRQMVGVTFFSGFGLAALAFKLDEWLKKTSHHSVHK